MKAFNPCLSLLAVVVVGSLIGCSMRSTRAADVSDKLRKSLDQAGFQNVSASQDRDKGVVTLSGRVAVDAAKWQAESIAKSIAIGEAVSNRIVVVTPGTEDRDLKDLSTVNPHLDKRVEQNAGLMITSQLDPGSHCKKYTDIYLEANPSRPISVDVKRSDNADKQTSVSTYTLYPSRRSYWIGGRRSSNLLVGCQFDGSETNTYTITRADYVR
jgi:hypothetical protein